MKITFAIACLVSGICMAESLNESDAYPQVKAYMELNGVTNIEPLVMRDGSVVKHINLKCGLPVPADWPAYSISKLPSKYRKIVLGQWVEKTEAEKIAADTAEVTASVTNMVEIMSLLEAVNEKHGAGTKDITISNLVERVRQKKGK